jgi:hypothetical protein
MAYRRGTLKQHTMIPGGGRAKVSHILQGKKAYILRSPEVATRLKNHGFVSSVFLPNRHYLIRTNGDVLRIKLDTFRVYNHSTGIAEPVVHEYKVNAAAREIGLNPGSEEYAQNQILEAHKIALEAADLPINRHLEHITMQWVQNHLGHIKDGKWQR